MDIMKPEILDLTDLTELDDYDSPINLYINRVNKSIEERAKELDKMVYSAVLKCGVDIDEKKLIAALNADKERYREAYKRGFNAAMEMMRNAIENRMTSQE